MADAVMELLGYFSWKGLVGCGFPTRLKDATVLDNSNLHKDWDGVDLKKHFESRTGLRFRIGNDADVAGLAEMKFGAGQGQMGTVIMCTFGTGIGSGMFLDGQLIPNTEFGKLMRTYSQPWERYAADSVRKRKDLTYEEWGIRVNEYFKHVEYLFSPSLFIIGGGASKKLDLFEDRLDLDTPIVAADLLNVAGTVGAAMLWQD